MTTTQPTPVKNKPAQKAGNPKTFFQKIEAEIDTLMSEFRALNQGLSENPAAAPLLKQFFAKLFALQSFVAQHSPGDLAQTRDSHSREKLYEALFAASRSLDASQGTAALLASAIDAAIDVTGAQRGFLALVDAQGSYTLTVARNIDGKNIPAPEREISDTVIRRALKLRREIQLESDQFDESLLAKSSIMQNTRQAILCVPILFDSEAKGVMYLDQFRAPLSPAIFGVSKHFSLLLGRLLKSAGKISALTESNRELLASLNERYQFQNIICKSKVMIDVLKTVAKVADTNASILLVGETGVGKDLIARAIHENSRRKDQPFVEVDCGALPPNLLESELFGHAKGAFTGAQIAKTGLLEAAAGGTLFLDEINNLPIEAQAKLLRALQTKSVRRIGETRERPLDFRLVAASSRNLQDAVTDGKFREDLYYRINTIALKLPPLRERKADILPLAAHFLARFAALHQRPVTGFSPEFLWALEAQEWKGNVRELEHVIERAVILCDGDKLTPGDLPGEFHKNPALPPEDSGELSLEEYVNRAKKFYIEQTLAAVNGKKVKAAERLNINRSYLFQLIKQLGISA